MPLPESSVTQTTQSAITVGTCKPIIIIHVTSLSPFEPGNAYGRLLFEQSTYIGCYSRVLLGSSMQRLLKEAAMDIFSATVPVVRSLSPPHVQRFFCSPCEVYVLPNIGDNLPVPPKKKVIHKCPLLSVPSVLKPLNNGIVELAVVEDTIHDPPTPTTGKCKSNLRLHFSTECLTVVENSPELQYTQWPLDPLSSS